MSDTPRIDRILQGNDGLGGYWIPADAARTLERELQEAISERDSERRWADQCAAEAHRAIQICENVHDRILRGDSDAALMTLLEAAWKERTVIDRGSNPTEQGMPHGQARKD